MASVGFVDPLTMYILYETKKKRTSKFFPSFISNGKK